MASITFDQVVRLLNEPVVDYWVNEKSNDANTIDFENKNFQEPNDKPWIRILTRPGERSRESLGRKGVRKIHFKKEGELVVEVYIPKNTGMKDMASTLDEIENLYQSTNLSCVMCNDTRSEVLEYDYILPEWKVGEVVVEFEYYYTE